jgi:hypothetical protein
LRRIGIGIGLVCGALVAVWGGLWWHAARESERAIAAEVSALEAAGVRLTWRERRIGGFPLALTHYYEDLSIEATSGRWRLDLPRAAGEASVLAPDRLRLTLGETGEMVQVGTLDIDDGHGLSLRLAVGAMGLVVDAPLDPAAAHADIAATALSLVDVGGEALVEGVLDLGDLRGRIARHRTPAMPGDGHRVALQAERLALAIAPRLPGPLRRTEISGGAVQLDATLIGLRGPDLPTALAAPGQLALSIDMAEADVLDLVYDEQAGGAAPDFSALPVARAARLSGRLAHRLAVADGRLTLETFGSALTLDLAHESFGGRFDLVEAAGRFMMPLRETALPEPFALGFTLSGATPDASTWASLDPRGRLVRGPIAASVDIGGEAQLLTALGQADLVLSPVRIERIALNRLSLNGFGADAHVTGELFPVEGQEEPDGQLSATLTGWTPLMRALETLGLLDPAQSLMVGGIAEMLRDPARPDALRAEVELAAGSVTVNGRRFR